jgi:fructose-bisphosphate aldolase / 2-amino-3,7-dideoxy-D-threo-hept-6-ulosonate synthase
MVAEECELAGIPMLTEMIPADIIQHQFENKADRKWPADPDVVKYSARVAAELGADIVKGYYTGDFDTFKEVIDYCPAPYVVLSGPASGDPEVFLKFVKSSLDAGARGVSVGRNVWTHPNPAGMTKAICKIVHDDVSVEEAMEEIK